MNIEQFLAEVERAIEGTTTGEWRRTENDHDGAWTDVTASRDIVCRVPWSRDTGTSAHRDAAYIALVNPANMRLILDALTSEREARARAEAERNQSNRRWAEVCADFIALQKAIVGDSGLSAILRAEELVTAEARLKKAEAVIAKQRAALQPLASSVFNDNGDMSVNRRTPSGDEFIASYFAERAAAAWIAKEKTDGNQ